MTAYLSRRARILEALIRQLNTITKSNGYATDVYKVGTDVRGWQALGEGETPIIYVVDDQTRIPYKAGRTVEKEWDFNLFGVMRNRSQFEMEELIADIETCIFKNVTLSFDGVIPGPIDHMRVLSITTDNQLFSEIENSLLFNVKLTIRYTECVENVR